MSVSTLVPGIMVFANNPVAPASITTKVNHALQGTATVNDSETNYWGGVTIIRNSNIITLNICSFPLYFKFTK